MASYLWQIIALSALAGALVAAAVLVLLSHRVSDEQRERLRRSRVGQTGRLGEAVITGADEHRIYYSYTVNGVAYAASQDISWLRVFLPTYRMAGPVTIKYSTRNPANSVVISESWSGLPLHLYKEHTREIS